MEAGEIRQVGTPAEIYNLPNSRYVAELIGAPPMNFVDGALVDGGRFEGRDVPLAITLEGAEGKGPAALAVRPEDLEIDTFGAVANGGIEASIYEVEPLGAFTIVDVSAGKQILKVQAPGQPQFALGERVSLVLDPDRCHVFRGETGDLIRSAR